ncbi:MAG: hemerythrin domain-containing protein [Caldimonas sp.]
MATAKKAIKKSPAAKPTTSKKVSTAAKKPYPDNTGENTQPPKMRPLDAVDLLVADHLAAGKCFKQYETLMKKNAPDAKRVELAKKVCGMLKVHTQIEEEIFYPAARAAGLDIDVMDEAYVEHAGAKELIAKIESTGPAGEYFDAQVKVLGDLVNHHVVEEQTEMFPKCRRSKMDLVAIREQLAARKKELEGVPSNARPGLISRLAGGLSAKRS